MHKRRQKELNRCASDFCCIILQCFDVCMLYKHLYSSTHWIRRRKGMKAKLVVKAQGSTIYGNQNSGNPVAVPTKSPGTISLKFCLWMSLRMLLSSRAPSTFLKRGVLIRAVSNKEFRTPGPETWNKHFRKCFRMILPSSILIQVTIQMSWALEIRHGGR